MLSAGLNTTLSDPPSRMNRVPEPLNPPLTYSSTEAPSIVIVPDPEVICVWDSVAAPVNVDDPEPVTVSICFSTTVPVIATDPVPL